MRTLALALLVAACGSEPATAVSSQAAPAAQPSPADARAGKPPDELDERMRHCPVALDGARSTLEDIDGGVRFTIAVPEASLREARRRAHHVVEFAAKRTRDGHGGFDGKGGGRMKNCPVITDGVAITATDVPGGAQLDVVALAAAQTAQLRADTRAHMDKFPFVGATIAIEARP
jgi:hypothetical protein